MSRLESRLDTPDKNDSHRLGQIKSNLGKLAASTFIGMSALYTPFGVHDHAVRTAQDALAAPDTIKDYSPRYDCDMPEAVTVNYNQDQLRQAAFNCIALRQADVAIVGFGGMTIERLTEITHQASRAVDTAFDGIVAPRLVPILASPAVENAFKEANEDCVDAGDIDRYASRIADKTMQLDTYANVVALTGMQSCEEDGVAGPKGVSNGMYDKKYIDVYDVPKTESSGQQPAETLHQAAVIAHELGHGFMPLRFGHAGSIVTYQHGDSIRIQPGFEPDTDIRLKPTDVDVSKLVYDNAFKEYGAIMNIMGGHTINATNAELNTMQLRKAMWPERILNNERDPMVLINGTNARFERPIDPLHPFAALLLNKPVVAVARDEHGHEVESSFDHLLFDPLPTSKHGPGSINVQVYLADKESTKTMYINGISGDRDSPYETVITIQDQSVKLSIKQDDSFFVTDISK